MTTRSDDMASVPASADATVEQRLHPWSWLFVLIGQLKQFAIPLLVLLFTGRGDRNELWPLIGVGVLMLTSALQYFTYCYRIGSDGITIRSGWLQRSRREIPYARIHNVVLQQSLLHRLVGVAEVRLESAGGHKPEARMRVLRLDQALALERLVRDRGHAASPAQETDGALLLALPPAELVRLGLISNRGLIVVGAAFAAIMQFSPRLLTNLAKPLRTQMFGWAGAHDFGTARYVLAAVSLVLVFVLLLRLLSVALALVQYAGFRLTEHGRRLTVERGLLARLRTSATRRRLQAWTLSESLLHRCFHRRSLQVDSAVGEEQEHHQHRALRELAPIATPEACDALIRHLLPEAGWDALQWQPLHAHAWRRLLLPGVLFALIATTALSWRFGNLGLLALLWLPWSIHVARQHARRAGYALNDRLVAVRGGWWSRHWRFAEIDKLQALRLSRNPVDRRCGTATLWLDTAGATAMGPSLRIRFLPEAVARTLSAQLLRTLAQRRLQW